MNRTPDRQGVHRILAAVALPLLLAVLVPLGAAARPPAVLLDGGSGGAAPGPAVVGVYGASGDPIGGERLPPRILDQPVDPVTGLTVAVMGPGDQLSGSRGIGGNTSVSAGRTWGWGWTFLPPLAGLSLLLLRLGAGIGRSE